MSYQLHAPLFRVCRQHWKEGCKGCHETFFSSHCSDDIFQVAASLLAPYLGIWQPLWRRVAAFPGVPGMSSTMSPLCLQLNSFPILPALLHQWSFDLLKRSFQASRAQPPRDPEQMSPDVFLAQASLTSSFSRYVPISPAV